MDAGNVAPAAVQAFIKIDKNYIKSIAGILKPIEFLLLLLAWALCASFRNGYILTPSSAFNYSTGAVGFFLFVTVTLWLFVIFIYILHVLSLMERLKIPSKKLILAIFHGVWALLLLISSAIVAADAVKLSEVMNLCDTIRKSPFYSTTCGTYDAAVAFGIFSCLAFVVDTVVHVFNSRSQQ